MTTIYHRDKRSIRQRTMLLVGAFLVILVLGSISPVRDFLQRTVLFVVVPLWKGQSVVMESGETLRSYFSSKSALERENRELKLKLQEYQLSYWASELVHDDRDMLRDALGRSSTTPSSIIAYVLKVPNRVPYDTIVVDVGEDEGITMGDEVFTEGRFAIGVVRNVSAKTSVVELKSSPGESHEVVVGETHIPATAHGVGGGNFRIELPQSAEVVAGDSVSFSGAENRILGVVEHVSTDERTGITTILLKLPINLYELHTVIIERQPQV